MAKPQTDTKQKIIEAAGQLFAFRGLEGTSIRAIVKKAGVALCSVNYHYESKEQLYVECLRYVLQDRLNLEEELAILDDERVLSPPEIAALLERLTRTMYRLLLNPENPEWYGYLLVRAKQEDRPASKPVITAITNHERIKSFLIRHLPGLDEEHAHMMVFNMVAQIQYYVVSRRSVLKILGRSKFNDELIDRIAGHTTSNMLNMLKLES